jgi:hypothetical protein
MNIGIYEQSFNILFVLRELCASVVKHFFQWTLFDARMAVDES